MYIYPTLPGIELTTCYVSSAGRSNKAAGSDLFEFARTR